MTMFRLPFVCFAAALLPAQDPIPAKAFLPDDHRNVVFADLKALRDRGIWEDLEVSVLKFAFQQMEKEAGFRLAALDRVTGIAEPPAETEAGLSVRQVFVFEANQALGIPESVARGSWRKETIGAHEVHQRDGMGGETFVRPRPEMRVWGTTDIVKPVLEGKPHTGQPCADVMSLLSGRGDNLAYMAIDVGQHMLRERMLVRLLGEASWPEGDEPSFVLLRLRATGDADEPQLEVEAVIRHKKDGEGLAATDKLVDGWIEKTKKDPQFVGLKPLWPRLERKKDRTDVTLRVALGRPREAVGYVALLMAPLLPGKPGTVEAVPARVEKAPEAEPAPEKKKDR